MTLSPVRTPRASALAFHPPPPRRQCLEAPHVSAGSPPSRPLNPARVLAPPLTARPTRQTLPPARARPSSPPPRSRPTPQRPSAPRSPQPVRRTHRCHPRPSSRKPRQPSFPSVPSVIPRLLLYLVPRDPAPSSHPQPPPPRTTSALPSPEDPFPSMPS